MGLLIANKTDLLIEGAGSPEGVRSAKLGTKYKNTVTGDVYEKTTRTGNTGWKLLGGGGGGGGGNSVIDDNL